MESQKLLPKKDDSSPQQDQAFNFPYEYDFEVTKQRKGRYLEYEVNGDRLIPTSFESRFHLTKIYLEKGYVTDAEELLFDYEAECTHKQFSQEESESLKKIFEILHSGDISTLNIRVRLHAWYLLEKNLVQFSETGENTVTKQNVETYLEVLKILEELLTNISRI